jgi:hypothetical protein
VLLPVDLNELRGRLVFASLWLATGDGSLTGEELDGIHRRCQGNRPGSAFMTVADEQLMLEAAMLRCLEILAAGDEQRADAAGD